MAFSLHRVLLRQLRISSNRSISSQSYTSKTRSDIFKIPSLQFIDLKDDKTVANFTPRILNIDKNYLSFNDFNISSKKIIKCPLLTNLEIIEPAKSISVDYVEDFPTTSLDLPTTSESVVEKQAARLIGIRKKKMKKHKLKKLRKRMKFEWAKVRQKREMRKEKAFQAELIAQIKVAEQFDAAQYVASRIDKATEVVIPRFWKGKRLPQFLIKQLMGLDK